MPQVPAVASGWLREIKSTLILQPGPAALTDGLDALAAIVAEWVESRTAPPQAGNRRHAMKRARRTKDPTAMQPNKTRADLWMDLALMAFLIGFDVAARLLPHAPGVWPVAATALFAGRIFRIPALALARAARRAWR